MFQFSENKRQDKKSTVSTSSDMPNSMPSKEVESINDNRDVEKQIIVLGVQHTTYPGYDRPFPSNTYWELASNSTKLAASNFLTVEPEKVWQEATDLVSDSNNGQLNIYNVTSNTSTPSIDLVSGEKHIFPYWRALGPRNFSVFAEFKHKVKIKTRTSTISTQSQSSSRTRFPKLKKMTILSHINVPRKRRKSILPSKITIPTNLNMTTLVLPIQKLFSSKLSVYIYTYIIIGKIINRGDLKKICSIPGEYSIASTNTGITFGTFSNPQISELTEFLIAETLNLTSPASFIFEPTPFQIESPSEYSSIAHFRKLPRLKPNKKSAESRSSIRYIPIM